MQSMSFGLVIRSSSPRRCTTYTPEAADSTSSCNSYTDVKSAAAATRAQNSGDSTMGLACGSTRTSRRRRRGPWDSTGGLSSALGRLGADLGQPTELKFTL
jgi:hypothetical protein